VKLTLDYRHIDAARFESMGKEIEAAIAVAARKGKRRDRRRAGLELGQRAVRGRLHRASEVDRRELGLPYREMRSQAGHDAYAVATMARPR